jgi:formiminotetrahydrofolate cyclodeaminase
MGTEFTVEDSGGLLTGLSVSEFLDRAAAALPVPGGGGIAALSGAAAAAMMEMALNFTVGRKKFAAVEAQARQLLEKVSSSRKRLVELVGEDAAAYGAVSAALKMPAAQPPEKTARAAALKDAMKAAIAPPLETVRVIRALADVAPGVLRIANPNLASDVAVAAAILPGAAKAAALNVWMNVSAFDGAERENIEGEVRDAASRTDASCAGVLREVESRLCPAKKTDSSSQ